MSLLNNGRFKRTPAVVLTAADVDYLDGLLAAFDDFPDGAWQAACEEAIGRDPTFRGKDPYEVWLEYCQLKSEEQGGA